MISKKQLAASLAGVASLVLIAGSSLGAVSASAAGPADTVVCAVVGSVTVTGGPAVTGGHNDPFAFNTTTITCENPASPFAGSYNVTATGTTSALNSAVDSGETCAQGAGAGALGGGVSGNFTFTRVGTHVTVQGNISANGNSGKFVAALEFIPTAGPCVGGSGNTIATLAGTAVVQDAA
jgi:hypothetical protein